MEDISLAQIFIKKLKLAKLLLTPFQDASTTICHRGEIFFPPTLFNKTFAYIQTKLNYFLRLGLALKS